MADGGSMEDADCDEEIVFSGGIRRRERTVRNRAMRVEDGDEESVVFELDVSDL